MKIDFEKPDETQFFWDKTLLPHWSHYNRPMGQRFMGSFLIDEQETRNLLKLVGANLKKVGDLTEKRLTNRFGEASGTWGKIVTLALSEYAYYYSESNIGFWNGFFQYIQIDNTQPAENALRATIDHGFNTLGLIRAKGGYRYVSTLWLQSGVPQRNLEHFAQLVWELQVNYGWDHLAEADAVTLSEILLDTCCDKHSQWGTLKNFLSASCTDNEVSELSVEPLSGQLLQGIAIVAQMLEQNNLTPEILLNNTEREALLSNSYLPRNFFLRSWKTFTHVIKLRDSDSSRKRLVSCRPRKALLELNLVSFETQFTLPEQTIWKRDWKQDLRGTYCRIPESDWEGTLPVSGGLKIPEIIVPVESESDHWSLSLLDHRKSELHKWDYLGVLADKRYLIFDCITGEHLSLSDTKIIGYSEVFCFAPKEVMIEPGLGIEIRERGVPSSLRGWHGLHLERIQSQSKIILKDIEGNILSIIEWHERSQEPMMQGLRLPGKRSIYLSVPILWLPIVSKKMELNVLLKNLADRSVLEKRIEEIGANLSRSLPLDTWIQIPGQYEISLWNPTYRWSCRFEVRQDYQVKSPTTPILKIRYENQDCTHLPIQVEKSSQFWAAVIEIYGLWPMESITIRLSSNEAEIDCGIQADSSGNLSLSLAQFYESLPSSERYSLSYQIVGQSIQMLLELGHNSPKIELPHELATTEVVVKNSPRPVSPERVNPSDWHFVSLKSRKRDLFIKLLKLQIDNSSPKKTGILEFKECNSDFPDHILIQVLNFKLARQTLQSIEGFADLQRKPLKGTEVKRMET